MSGSQVSSSTTLRREVVVTFCRARLVLFIVFARNVFEDTDRLHRCKCPAAFGQEVVAICCLAWHFFVFAGFSYVGCGLRSDPTR